MKTIALSNGKLAMVDDEDYERFSKLKWKSDGQGYAMHRVVSPEGRKDFSMHRILMGLERGDGRMVDHIDGDRLNNQKSNLRICVMAQNQWNRGAPRNNTSGYKGVSKVRNSDRWRANITVNKKVIYLGTFETPDEAHLAYCKAAAELHGEFAYLGELV